MLTSFYSKEEIELLGLQSYGNNVLISRKVSIYSPETLSIGNNVRIDDFCILSGNIKLGSNIHIAAFCAFYGSLGIMMEDYSGCSSRTTIYSAMDDFSGDYLVGPTHPEGLTNVTGGEVVIKRFAQIGAGCVVFPNITIPEGCVVGAMSLVSKELTPWSINIGVPAKKIKDRSKELLCLLNQYDEFTRGISLHDNL